MNNRAIRELPFPRLSHFTSEMIKQIKAIPDDEIRYTEKELAWMERAVQNLDYMIALSESFGLDTEIMIVCRAQIEFALTSSEKSSFVSL